MAHHAHFDVDADFNAEKKPVVDRMDAEYTIYVNNLPLELNEEAIRDIFSDYGKIVEMFHPRNAKWVYITYGTFREAELAIRELDNKKPLYLKVALAKERSVREEKPNVSETFERSKVGNTADSLPACIKHPSIDHSESINASSKHAMPQITAHRSANSGSSAVCQSYEIDDPYTSTNQLWTRGVITVTPDGRRHVSLGRGYTLYSFPEPDPNIENYISKICEQRSDELYEYPKNKSKLTAQDCAVCSTRTTKHCAKCTTYYCSKPCQMKDWPQHQMLCERVPELVEETNNDCKSSLQVNQEVDQTKTSMSNAINKTTKVSDLKLRRPNTLNTMQAENLSNTSISNSTRKRHDQHDNVSQHTYVSPTKNANQPAVVSATNDIKEFSQHRVRKYSNNESPNHSRKNNSATYNSTDQSLHSRNYQSDSNKVNVNKERYDNSNIRDRTYNNDRNSPQKNSFQNDKSSICYDRENVNRPGIKSLNNTLEDNDLAFYKDTNLSKTKFITVEVIISLNSDEYWIYKLEDAEARLQLMTTLQNVVKTSCNMQPIIGEIYGVMYNTIWCRALVTSLNPTTVHFIDFGNTEILEKDSVIKDIGDLIKSPKFARKIRLTQGTSDKYRNLQEGDKISVKMLSIDSDKTIIVEVEQKQSENLSLHTTENISNNVMKKCLPKENSKVTSPDKSRRAVVQMPNILSNIYNLMGQEACSEYKIEGILQFVEFLRKNIYSVTLCPLSYKSDFAMLLEDLQVECKKIKETVNYKPKEGDIVCFKCNDDWYRGCVLTPLGTSYWSILSLDEAKVLSIDKVFPCPEKFLNICSLGVICEISDSTAEVVIADPYSFTAVLNEENCNQERLVIDMIINEKETKAVLRPWKSTNSPTLFELKSGSKVCLTCYQNQYSMYARCLDNEAEEYFNHVMQSVARVAETAPHLTVPPTENQVVIAPFDDGNNYRAIILKIQNDKAKIIYIDFGNMAEIDIKNLKEMPECSLLYQKGCAGRVILKDVPRDIPNNKEVDLYLRYLAGNEVPLMCTFEGESAKDGAYLTTLTGESVNDKIKQQLIPTWQRENDGNANKCYMFSDMETANLGNLGDTVDALVLNAQKDAPSIYYISPYDFELLSHVYDVMPALIKKQCEKTEYYIPRAHELCLAMYEGSWYRAVCFNPKESCLTARIFFVDYGNTEIIEHKNIRWMPEEFITPPMLANMCTVVNLAPVDCNKMYSKAVQKKLDELVKPNTQIKIKIVQREEGDYQIELPEVRAELIKYGLL